MKIFITGISGLLGINLAYHLRPNNEVYGCYNTHQVVVDRVTTMKMDLANSQTVKKTLSKVQPDVVINTVAISNVDYCQTNPELAHTTNVLITKHIAESCSSLGIKLVHISTDHLFDGLSQCRTEEDTPAPLNTYAHTKLQSEIVASDISNSTLIIRTNFFGWGSEFRKSFSDWILSELENERPLHMFTDAFFNPILMNYLIDFVMQLVELNAHGIYHVSGSERISKYEFALLLAEKWKYPTDNIHKSVLADAHLKAPRPADMSLSCEKAERILQSRMPSVPSSINGLKVLHDTGYRYLLRKAIH